MTSSLSLLAIPVSGALLLANPVVSYAQEILPDESSEAETDDLRPTAIENGVLSMNGGQRLMQEARDAVSAQNYTLAADKLQDARQVFNQLSNFYGDLSSSFTGIDNRISESNRRLALEAAQMRDQATYQLALVHRAQNQPDLAVPLLIQIIRSQQPTRELGQQAYQQLFELGFVESNYPRTADDGDTGSSSSL